MLPRLFSALGTSPRLLLELDLSRGLTEGPPGTPLDALRARHKPTMQGLVESLEKAAEDRRVVGLVLHLGAWQPSLSQSCELRAAVARLRAAGKRTVAWSESYGEMGPGNTAYHLASVCEQVWLQPSGDLGLVGLTAQAVFVRDALDKVGVEPQLGQRHEFKTAADTFLTSTMTGPHREMLTRLVESATGTLVEDVADSRGLTVEAVTAILDEAPLSAARAVEAGLVDRVGYRDEVYAAARAADAADGDVELLFLDRYSRSDGPMATVTGLADRVRTGRIRDGGPVVAVVHAVGAIHLGPSGGSPLAGRSVGSDTLGAALRAAGRDESVRAVVLRVDSPGGSYVASDTLRREVLALREAGTTVVASMAGVAASGGYFIAMPCEVVVATPGTLTGSIGVLAGKQVLRDALGRVGLRRESVSTGRFADMFSADRPFDDQEWERLEHWLDTVYDDFTAKAAADRGMAVEDLRAVARGRVWTGADAAGIGLVDELGGLSRAVDVACDRAGLDRAGVTVRAFPRVNVVQRLLPADNSEAPAAAAVASNGLVDGLPARLLARLSAEVGLPAHGVLTMAPSLRLV